MLKSPSESNGALIHPPGPVLSTMEEDGTRRWLYPRLSKGRFWQARRIVAYVLIALFTLIPYTYINHKPAMLLDIVHRRFTLFGYTFLPTDTVLLALLMVGILLSIFFVTALFGRVWCGWGCPQTVYMEFVFRPLERLFTGRGGTGGKPRPDLAAWRRVLLHLSYVLVSCYLANTFLAYFVGVEQLRHWVTTSPIQHPTAFLVMAATAGLMLFNFRYFREQTCLIACPYGRFQSVLLDRQSLIVKYDENRGEPRGRLQRTAHSLSLPVVPDAPAEQRGDCIDCDLCVAVCPTGIDIRDGLQFECVGCTQCIDACNAVMDKIGKPRNLIRYGSQAAGAGERVRTLRPRVLIYATLVTLLATVLTTLIVTKPTLDVGLLRGPGKPFILTGTGEVENLLRVKLTNRSDRVEHVRISAAEPAAAKAVASQEVITLVPGQMWAETVQVTAPQRGFVSGSLPVTIRVSCDDGTVIDRRYKLLGPMTALPSTGPAGAW